MFVVVTSVPFIVPAAFQEPFAEIKVVCHCRRKADGNESYIICMKAPYVDLP